MPRKPSAAISFTSSRGTALFSSISRARGRTLSVANSRAVRCASCCSSVSSRSKLAAVSVCVAVAWLLTREEPDVPSVGVFREEEVSVQIADSAPGRPRARERGANVRDAEPRDEAALGAHLGIGLPVLRIVDQELQVFCLEPRRVALHVRRETRDVRVEARDLGTLLGEHHHWTHACRARFLHAYTYTPRPLLRPSQPAATYWRRSGAGRYFGSPRSRCRTSRIARHTSSPMRSARR